MSGKKISKKGGRGTKIPKPPPRDIREDEEVKITDVMDQYREGSAFPHLSDDDPDDPIIL